ncbi:SEC-C metal-binding domain-containing protein [Desulfosporosinus sp. SB140]|uniref:SEC-C metal-binding domain-containing protein n=1 Tax=Desulfosporosinus paludis TaxID=3115649 RepID=UPI00388DFC80
MSEYIREVEMVIDEYHKQSPIFLLNRKTALYNALTVFEDFCRLGGATELALTGDSLEFSFLIRQQLDALNILIQWIYQDCPSSHDDVLDMTVVPERYIEVADLLQKQARSYSPICSAYISYSRGNFSAQVNESQKKITFLDNPENRKIVIADMMETILRDQATGLQFAPTVNLSVVSQKLIASIRFQDAHISYSIDNEIWDSYEKVMERQWIQTSELPEEWAFDLFTIGDFKRFWVAIATLSIIHMTACLKSGIQGADVEEAVIVKAPSEFIQIVAEKASISIDIIHSILSLLTYNNKLPNNDIVYQPFVLVDKTRLALAPHLILASRPERNLISLIHKLRDKSYFDLTNLREGIMQNEFSSAIENLPNIKIATNKALPNRLPDADYSIWDMTSNTILVSELKWLVVSDSTQEVFARTQELEHGCNQISAILDFAYNNCADFCSRVFNITDLENTPEIIGCVVSKMGIRVNNTNIPVISLKTLLDLFQRKSNVREVFEIVKNRGYLLSAPHGFEYALTTFCYAGYSFEIPAFVKDRSAIHGTYKRIGSKLGRNVPCSCGSGKKYKKCCGKYL